MTSMQNKPSLRQSDSAASYADGPAAERPAQFSAARQWISNEMRRLYNEVVNEPLPPSFQELIEKLEAREDPETHHVDRKDQS
jgi:hypothetical protein